MVTEYESVSARLREVAAKWIAAADKMDKYAEELGVSGEMPPSIPHDEGWVGSRRNFSLDREACVVTIEGSEGLRVVKLGPQEFRILDLFCQHLDEVITREQIVSEVWHGDGGNEHLVRVYVSNIRRKLGVIGGIDTVRNAGYVMKSTGEGEKAG